MSNALLREYLSLVLERIKSGRGSAEEKERVGKFDLNRFKGLSNAAEMLEYADKRLQKLGEGTARAAFVLTGRHVLKVALNAKGLAQNEAELAVYTNPEDAAHRREDLLIRRPWAVAHRRPSPAAGERAGVQGADRCELRRVEERVASRGRPTCAQR